MGGMVSLSSSTHTRVSHRFGLAAAIIGVAAVATAIVLDLRRDPIRAQTVRYEMLAPDNEVVFQFAVSPDGQQVAFTTQSSLTVGLPRPMRIRRLDALQAQPVEGTDSTYGVFWSPDGRSIAFFAGDQTHQRNSKRSILLAALL